LKAILIHGGAGSFKSEEDYRNHRNGLREAIERGYTILLDKNSALEGVIGAIKLMEEDPTFNCGRGSVLTLKGNIEMDAAIMDSYLNAGAVTGIKDVLHPIEVARAVMEQTDHVLLSGEGLEEFVRVMGFQREKDLVVPHRLKQWEENTAKAKSGELKRFGRAAEIAARSGCYYSTVGAVAIDDSGKIVAATSTGGMTMKVFGRIGDSPIFGAGTYADQYGAISATGHGEKIMKLTLCRLVGFYMEKYPAQKAVDLAIEKARYSDCECGLIALDRFGNIGIGYTAKDMSWAYIKEGKEAVVF
jgi:beta-aspartyl-peptidase (threonine type)